VDGDTLRDLAKRYLGSEGRQWEIYQANTDLLSHPEVLPVGIEIRIPAQRPDPPFGVIPRSRLMPPAIQPFAPAPVRTNSELIAVPDGSAGSEVRP
jgi:hypothetical protein